MESVLHGLNALTHLVKEKDWIVVHDAARCVLHPDDLNAVIDAVYRTNESAFLGKPVTDTLKQQDPDTLKITTLPRTTSWQAQTPQVCRYDCLVDALLYATKDKVIVTDEAEAMERAGYPIHIVASSQCNMKITHPEDVVLASAIVNQREG
jgi:2-C-methyl-D-erythritol 4-phosphate cytidylyltransferase